MAFPIGSIPLTGAIGTTDSSDVFATHISWLGKGGLHDNLADNTERDAITADRRQFGMLASVLDGNLYRLCNIAMGGNSNVLTDNLNWKIIVGPAGTGFVPGGEDLINDRLWVGTSADPAGFNNVAVFGSATVAQADGEFRADNYSSVHLPDLTIQYGSSFGIGTSSAGFFGNAFSARLVGSAGGQNVLELNNGTGVQEYAWGNFHAAGVNPTGAWFNSPGGFAAFSQDEYVFLQHDTATRVTTIGDADGKSGNGAQVFVDDQNDTVGTRGYKLDLNAGDTSIEVWNGATRVLHNDVPSRYMTVGEENYGYGNPAYIEFNNSQFQMLRGGNAWFWSVEDGGNPSSGSSGMGDRYGNFNSTQFIVDDNTTYFHFTQGGRGFYVQAFGDNMRIVTQSGSVYADLPTTLGTAGDVMKTDGAGGWYWDTAGGPSLSMGAIDFMGKSIYGGFISGGQLFLQTADTTYPGYVSTTTQSFAGNKTFEGNVIVGVSGTTRYLSLMKGAASGAAYGTNEIRFSHTSGNELAISYGINGFVSNFNALGSATYSFPAQTGTIALQNTIGTAGTAPAWVSSALNIPLAGASVTSGTVSNGTQTIAGAKTLSSKTTFATPTTSIASVNFPVGSAPTTPVSGDVWHNTTQKALFLNTAGVTQNVSTCLFTQSTSVTQVNTASEVTITSTGVGTKTLPANFWAVGKSLGAGLRGVHSTTGTPTLTIKVKHGAIVLAQTTITTGSGVTNAAITIDFDVTCRTIGASGTLIIDGVVGYETATGVRAFAALNNGISTVTVDTTASAVLDVTATWSAASASNTITMTQTKVGVSN